MTLSCFHCDTDTTVDLTFEPTFFVCPNCQSVYGKDSDAEWRVKHKLKGEITQELPLQLGQKGTIYGVTYTIAGILVKSSYSYYHWVEYVLVDDAANFRYLSESQGHWIWMQKIPESDQVNFEIYTAECNGETFDLYDNSTPKLLMAHGYFDYDIQKKYSLREYINPPHLLSKEEYNNYEVHFKGEHISRRNIKKAFNCSVMPPKIGVGIVQPPVFSFQKAIIVFASVGILMLFTLFFRNLGRNEAQVVSIDLPMDKAQGSTLNTPSFTLEGMAASLKIDVSTNVDNSWASLEVALINEITQDEVYANKDVEYYHGYEGGENWTEGSTSESFTICGVGPGKYHLALTPSKESDMSNGDKMYVTAQWEVPTLRNFLMTLLFMGIALVGGYYLNLMFLEKPRWQDSDYSPYEE